MTLTLDSLLNPDKEEAQDKENKEVILIYISFLIEYGFCRSIQQLRYYCIVLAIDTIVTV